MNAKFSTMGIRETTELRDEIDKYSEEITLYGFTVIPDVLPSAECQTIRQKVQVIYQQQVQELGGEQTLGLIQDANISRCLLAYDDYFAELALHDKVLGIIRRCLGAHFILMMQNATINMPALPTDSNTWKWHRDLPYQHFVASRPLAIGVLFCIDEFSETSGGTYVLPGTHKVEAFPSQTFVEKHEQVVTAPVGSAIIFDAMLFHRAGHNKSAQPRLAVHHMYSLPLIKQQISFPRILKGKFQDDARLKSLLGYESESGESVLSWRQQRLARRGAD